MSEVSDVKKLGKGSAVIQVGASAFAVTSNLNKDYFSTTKKVDWESDPAMVSGKKIVPYGLHNDLPDKIRYILDRNNLAPGILEREIGLLYGSGPQLYRMKYEDGHISREYIEDPEIESWLNSWDYKRFIDMAIVEFKHLKAVVAKRKRNKGFRIGREAQIASLEVVPGTDARLAWPETGSKRLENVKYIYTGDFSNNCYDTGISTYPVYDPYAPFKHAVSIGFHSKYSFGMSFYPKPSFYGTLPWMERSSDIPEILAYLSENGITSAYHIHSPAQYWEAKMERLEKIYPDKPEAYREKKLEEIKDQLFKKMAEVLTGKKNAGKFIETVDFTDEDGNKCEWKVESLDQKIKDFVDAQLKISDKADSAITSGIGLHPSLSNIVVNGQLSSGSQMLYALKLYMASDTTIPEEVVFEPINQAIAANFPKKKVRLGFYHPTVEKEENVSPENRLSKTAEEK
ncbi:MAG: hypothetical protein RIC03_12535 [Cyclobacteriaceae bacterium]